MPLANRDRLALQGLDDFWRNPRIKADAILAAQVWRTVNRSECNGLVLAVQDTTERDYSGHHNQRGLGDRRGAQTPGALLHSVLGVSSAGLP